MRQHVDLLYDIEQRILQNRTTSVLSRRKSLHSVVFFSAMCFSSGHRTIYKDHLLGIDVSFRKLCRSIVVSPSNIDWSLERDDDLHNCNIRVQDFASAAATKPWSRMVCKQHWGRFFSSCFATWHTCRNIAGYVGYWLGIQSAELDRLVSQGISGIKRSQLSVATNNLDISWNVQGFCVA